MSLGIVSKSVRKPAARLTLFQDSSRCQVAEKQRDDKYLESFESIEQNVKSVNLRLGSVRRSPWVVSAIPLGSEMKTVHRRLYAVSHRAKEFYFALCSPTVL